MITTLVPSHDEEDQIEETITSLQNQTCAPDEIVVILDNCTDRTQEIAVSLGVTTFTTAGNKHKKAGGLNQWLESSLSDLADDDHVMVMDADSSLDPKFIEYAMGYQQRGYPAVGGVFTGKSGGSHVGILQRNEFARYKVDVRKKRGKTLVLTGTATVFKAGLLKEVAAARKTGEIQRTEGYVYTTENLTEDFEISLAIQHLGHPIIAPAECALTTDIMTSWKALGTQRYRWKRGALECLWSYGFTRYTAKSWFLQVWGLIGIAATATYLTTFSLAMATGNMHLHLIWMAVTGIFIMERSVTVRARGWKMMAVAATLLYEMPFDLFLQFTHIRAIAGWSLRTNASW